MKDNILFEIKNAIGYTNEEDITIYDKENFKVIDYFGDEYIVCDSSSNTDNDNISSVMESIIKLNDENINYKFIFIFEDLNVQYEVVKKLSAKQAKLITQIIDRSVVIYAGEKLVNIIIEEEGINYLEYDIYNNNNERLVFGRTVNCKLIEMKKLYEIDGNNLFKRNVRQGINSNTKHSLMLKNSFKESLARMFYINLKLINFFDNDAKIEETAGLFDNWSTYFLGKERYEQYSNDYDSFESSDALYKLLNSFWYMHNGVTIISLCKDGLSMNKDIITIDCKSVQVLNGAQTISRWYQIIHELEILFNEKSEFSIIKSVMDVIISNLKLRVTFVNPHLVDDDTRKFIDDVTLGLNTQVPVTPVDIFLKSSSEVDELKELIYTYGKNIARTGESFDRVNSFEWKYFVQHYLIYIGKPGKARNLSNDYVNSATTASEIKRFLKTNDNIKGFLEFLELTYLIDRWWKVKPSIRNEKIIQDEKNNSKFLVINESGFSFNQLDYNQVNSISSNGLYLFKAYIAKLNLMEYQENAIESIESILNSLYTRMIESIDNQINLDNKNLYVDSNFFKGNDEFWEKIINRSQGETLKIESTIYDPETSLYLDELNKLFKEKHSNEISRIKSSNFVFINEFYKSKNISVDNIRTISVGKHGVKEAFPFKSSSFMELININIEENPIFPNFIESEFYKQLKTHYNFFIFEEDIIKYKELNFDTNIVIDDAKWVYEKVVEAFERGDETLFIKESEDRSFHIRPKARDSEDVVRFTESKYITRMTFWANRKTIEKLIGK